MSCAFTNIAPIDRLDRELELMDRLVDQSPTGADVPHRPASRLLGALSETINLVNSGAYARAMYAEVVHINLCELLIVGAGLARRFGITVYHGDEWPDECHTRIGGDGALATGHDPQHLLSELLEAAGWVANWVHACTAPAAHAISPPTMESTWRATEPVTEFIARTWCLADRLDARQPLRALVNDYLASRPGE